MTRDMIDDVLAIRTNNGKRVFGWGGNWTTRKDTMHFYVDVPPGDLASGINWGSVKGTGAMAERDPWDGFLGDLFGGARRDQFDEDRSGGFDMASGFDELAPLVMRRLIADFDLTPEQAAGIVGNLGAESNLKPIQEARPISGRGGFGWAQWTGSRRDSFERWCRENGLDIRSNAANYGYLKAELSGTLPGNDYRDVIRQLKTATTASGAAQIFERLYEKAGIKRMEVRIRMAERALELYQRSHLPEGPAMPERPEAIPPALWEIFVEWIRRTQQKPEPVAQTRDQVERLQRRLTELDYQTGGIDGIYGSLTRGAVAAFQVDNGLVGTGVADAETLAALANASPRPMAAGRVAATANDLRKMGSVEIRNADRMRMTGWLSGLLGVFGLGNSALGTGTKTTVTAGTGPEAFTRLLVENRDFFNQILGQDIGPVIQKAQQAAKPVAQTAFNFSDLLIPIVNSFAPGFGGSAVAIGLGIAAHLFGTNVINRRVENQRDGVHLGPVGGSR